MDQVSDHYSFFVDDSPSPINSNGIVNLQYVDNDGERHHLQKSLIANSGIWCRNLDVENDDLNNNQFTLVMTFQNENASSGIMYKKDDMFTTIMWAMSIFDFFGLISQRRQNI